MWYEIERYLDRFKVSNTSGKDLYLTLSLSEKCDIDVNYKVCIEEVIIEGGDSYTFNLPIKDGLYKLFLTDKEENYQEIFIPQYLELLSSLIEDIDYVLCGCDFKDCDGNDYDNDTEVLSTLLKILSYISINKNKYEKAIASSNACVECDILESNLCILINENVGENYQNKNLIKKLIAFYYLVFYYTDYKIENSLETIQQRYNFKKIYPCIKKLGLSIKCIEDNWDKGVDFENHKTYSNVTYEDLLVLINNNELVPNSSYRITNYTTTTVQADTASAGYDFDIIVTALSTNELSEVASCVRKAGDTYFENAKLEAWEIKYCIDNDTNRFAWADAVNGKGVIYYMKDEWNNECPYDFKNIQFKKSDVFLYTFGGVTDNSLTGGCHHNTMMDYTSSSVLTLNFNTFGTGCYYNTFGNKCNNNTFGNYCLSNTFGNYCSSNTFGNYCSYNTFGNYCMSNTFGNECNSNSFGYNCSSNTFGYIFNSNTFGNYCMSNTFGNECSHNTFGTYCSYNNFYTGTSGTTKKDFVKYVVLENGCRYNNFYSELTTSSTSFLQRIRIKGLENTSATDTQITLSETNTNYEWLVSYTSGGVLKQYCPEDSLANNYIYKIEDTVVSTWTASTAYAGYDYQAQINIPNLTENDNVSVIFDGAEVISGNYYPTIQIYEGYILIFSKIDTTITIPTIEITKIDI